MSEFDEADQSLLVEAALSNPEVKTAKANLLKTIKNGQGSVFLTSRFESGTKLSMVSPELGPISVANGDKSGYRDLALVDPLKFAPKNNSDSQTNPAGIIDNFDELASKGIINKFSYELVHTIATGAPMVVTLITDREKLASLGFDASLKTHCMVTAEVNMAPTKDFDRMERGGTAAMKYIIPTEIGEEVARVIQKNGPAAAWAILFDSVGYKLQLSPGTNYPKPVVNLTHPENLGVAFKKDKVAPVKEKKGWGIFGR